MKMKIITYLTVFIFFIVGNVMAVDVTLSWESNTEPDLAWYKVYYKTDPTLLYDIATPPEDIIDQGTSPIVIEAKPIISESGEIVLIEQMLTGLNLDNKDYYMVVTALNWNEDESGDSNEVNTIDMPPHIDDNNNSSDSSDNGSGCFISSILGN